MFYCIIAHEGSLLTENPEEFRKYRKLYLYPKVACFREREKAEQFMQRYKRATIQYINHYGSVGHFYVDMHYNIGHNCVRYKFETHSIGDVTIIPPNENYHVEKVDGGFTVVVTSINLSTETLAGHYAAIGTGLKLLGDYVDVDLHIPMFGVYYSLTLYDRHDSVTVREFLSTIEERIGKCSYTHGP